MHSEANQRLAAALVGQAYVRQGAQALQQREKLVNSLLSHRRMPQEGWAEVDIEALLHDLSSMDSNNFRGSVGLGEREARVASSLVQRMHYGFGHGIGRSGDVAAVQPKAAGSSLLQALTACMVSHALAVAGMTRLLHCIVLPTATGMSLLLVFLALKAEKPAARHALWFRIDQKSCLKSIQSSGLVPVVLANKLVGSEVCTDMDELSRVVDELGAESIACVVSTTSCFAPRGADDVAAISVFCKARGLAHVINNAYGVQSSKICHSINEACRIGRVDAVVQSTDKNFLVPVGGAVVAAPDPRIVTAVSKLYPGRASVAPVLDLFITLLSLGVRGWTDLLRQRKEVYPYLKQKLVEFSAAVGETVLESPHNPISIAVSLSNIPGDPKMFGSMVFSRGISGVRVVPVRDVARIGVCELVGFGSHIATYPVPYFTAAASLGLTTADVDVFVKKLVKVYHEARRYNLGAAPSLSVSLPVAAPSSAGASIASGVTVGGSALETVTVEAPGPLLPVLDPLEGVAGPVQAHTQAATEPSAE